MLLHLFPDMTIADDPKCKRMFTYSWETSVPFPSGKALLWCFKNKVTKRVFSRGYADAQTKPPGRVSSNETYAEVCATKPNSKDCSGAWELTRPCLSEGKK